MHVGQPRLRSRGRTDGGDLELHPLHVCGTTACDCSVYASHELVHGRTARWPLGQLHWAYLQQNPMDQTLAAAFPAD